MFLKSHKWVDVPITRYERRKVLNVRESTHTAMLYDRKYQNIDTGKFDTDKLHTLNNLLLIDLVEEESCESIIAPSRYHRKKRMAHDNRSNIYNFPKHVPKDNDFDEELRLEKESRDREYAIRRLEEHNRILAENTKKIEEESKRKEEIYQQQLRETEIRLAREKAIRERMMYNANNYHKSNVIVTRWKNR